MTKIEKSSGNVFADLGIPDAETHRAKANLVRAIDMRIKAMGFTQERAAKVLGMSQPDVSKMLRGQFRSVTIDRLVECLLALGVAVAINLGRGPKGHPTPASRLVARRGKSVEPSTPKRARLTVDA